MSPYANLKVAHGVNILSPYTELVVIPSLNLFSLFELCHEKQWYQRLG